MRPQRAWVVRARPLHLRDGRPKRIPLENVRLSPAVGRFFLSRVPSSRKESASTVRALPQQPAAERREDPTQPCTTRLRPPAAARSPQTEVPAATLSLPSSVPTGLRTSRSALQPGCDARPRQAPSRRSAAHASAWRAAVAPAAVWRLQRHQHALTCQQLEFRKNAIWRSRLVVRWCGV